MCLPCFTENEYMSMRAKLEREKTYCICAKFDDWLIVRLCERFLCENVVLFGLAKEQINREWVKQWFVYFDGFVKQAYLQGCSDHLNKLIPCCSCSYVVWISLTAVVVIFVFAFNAFLRFSLELYLVLLRGFLPGTTRTKFLIIPMHTHIQTNKV